MVMQIFKGNMRNFTEYMKDCNIAWNVKKDYEMLIYTIEEVNATHTTAGLGAVPQLEILSTDRDHNICLI